IAASNPTPKNTAHSQQSSGGQQFMDDFIQKHNIQVKSSEPHNGGTRYHLEACAWKGHTDNSATLFVQSDGTLGANCNHNSCEGLGWKDFRRVFEPNAYDKTYTSEQKREEQKDSKFDGIQSQVIDAVEKEDVKTLYD